MNSPTPSALAVPDRIDGDHLAGDGTGPAFWHELIDEKAAGDFLGITDRTMQTMRQRGGGPRYVSISARCLRYRRIDLKTWADSRLRSSTSDPGPEAATA